MPSVSVTAAVSRPAFVVASARIAGAGRGVLHINAWPLAGRPTPARLGLGAPRPGGRVLRCSATDLANEGGGVERRWLREGARGGGGNHGEDMVRCRAVAKDYETETVERAGDGSTSPPERSGYEVLKSESGALQFTSEDGNVMGAVIHSQDDDDTEDEDVSQSERRRREKISQANRGKTPWNKGRRHSAETKRKIRERTLAAMQRADVRSRLRYDRQSHTDETRKKISEGVVAHWQRLKEKRADEAAASEGAGAEADGKGAEEGKATAKGVGAKGGAVAEQQPAVATEAAGGGKTAKKAAPKAGGAKAKAEKKKAKTPGPRGAKSKEHREKIAAAIRAKWQDPEYRDRVKSGMKKSGQCGGSRPRKAGGGSRRRAPKKQGPTAEERLKAQLIAEKQRQMHSNAVLLLKQAEDAAAALEAQQKAGAVDESAVAAAHQAVASARAMLDQVTERMQGGAERARAEQLPPPGASRGAAAGGRDGRTLTRLGGEAAEGGGEGTAPSAGAGTATPTPAGAAPAGPARTPRSGRVVRRYVNGRLVEEQVAEAEGDVPSP